MKKTILLVPVFALMLACSGGTNETAETTEAQRLEQEQTEALEQSIQDTETAIQSSVDELDSVQNEIDTLLNEI